ncbi:4a-hydroxytetrahydrobiopterin dehydratase [Corynebacterium sp.]|uniref:4a-hydroxytetrahydrobiopterin dehydratase n=1 Tax=Corynebacterium sp. TaxID=1720 RepID=UPI0019CB1D91|nr:4a-hydroxytetrahydrobiopterin dehydratase [Corynebacterium sp.]HHU66815.1 4a-hydroxytetrahydrobiopterin dehydratase [Corynebacterium sp.]HKM24343.1 4a-hydroxytetrahydrobiopterin dehydratase [Corynebacterium sp.]
MTDTKKILSAAEIADADLTGWKNRGGHIEASFDTGDFATGLRLVNLIGASAEEADHHPDITLTYGQVDVALSSHDVGGLTVRDVRLARVINDHARGLNLS